MAVVSKATMGLGLLGIGVAVWLDVMVLEHANATVKVPVAAQTIPPYTTIRHPTSRGRTSRVGGASG